MSEQEMLLKLEKYLDLDIIQEGHKNKVYIYIYIYIYKQLVNLSSIRR